MALTPPAKKPSILERLRDFLDTLGAEDQVDDQIEADEVDDQIEADEVDDLDAPAPAVPAPDEAPEPDANPENEVDPEAGAGDTNPGEAAADDADETMPESEVSVAELRDALGKLGSENERLRSIIAELGGDAALGDEEVVEDVVEDEADDEYDDEAAQADIDEQQKQIAMLSGNK